MNYWGKKMKILWGLSLMISLTAVRSFRMVAGIWWFFTLIMISSYTANLAGKF